MYNTRIIGKTGEEIAERFLKAQGVKILKKNFYYHGGEVDLIVRDFDKEPYLVFVEVKYRSGIDKGFPEEAVTLCKQQRIIKGARFYMNMYNIPYSTACRFDVISITDKEIRWIKNAFTL